MLDHCRCNDALQG